MAAWNVDNAEGPHVVFEMHKNARDKLSFDVHERLGLLAAGGDGGSIRFWDLFTGGSPLAAVPFGKGIPLDVKMVCKDGTAPGLWVKTNGNVYVAHARI